MLVDSLIQEIQQNLDFQNYLGETLWLEFCTFRRDDKYSNSNYISDGLNNAELINNANLFIQVANKEIRKAAEIQHTISTSLKNLLAIKKFEPLVSHFRVGNWIRVEIDDEIYKLRLIKYEIDFDSLDNISVEFSDAINIKTQLNTIQTALDNAQSMASSYESVKRQAKSGANSDKTLTDIIEGGLSMSTISLMNNSVNQSQSWNERGMLFRTYDPIEEDYSNEQLKIINSTIAMTDNKWQATKTAIGKFFYYDPVTDSMKQAWGINGELLVGKMLLGESFGIYNKDGTLTFDDRGFIITNDINTVLINPNDRQSIFTIKNTTEDLFTFDANGDIVIVGNITAKSLTLSEGTTIGADKIDGLSTVAKSGKYDDLLDIPTFHDVAYSGEYDDLENKPVLATVATTGKYSDLLEIPNFHDVAYSGSYYDLENIPTFAAIAYSGKYDDLIDAPVLATVATTGQYSDLEGLPDLSQIDVNKAISEANKKNIDSLSDNVNSNLNDILTLQSDTEQIKSSIETLNSNVSTNTTNIGILQEEINTLKKELELLKNSNSETT